MELDEIRPIGAGTMKLLEEKTRRSILNLVSADELTVSQIAEELRMTPQNIYQQLGRLVEAGLVRATREERRGHLMERYYRAAAENFYYGNLDRERSGAGSPHLRLLRGLRERGLELEDTEGNAERLAEILSGRGGARRASTHEMCVSCCASRVFMKLGPADALTKETVLGLESLATMTDEEFEEYIGSYRRLRRFLRSITGAEGGGG